MKPAGTDVFFSVWKGYRSLLARADASKQRVGLGVSDFRILKVLDKNGALPTNAVGRMVELTTGSMTTAVDRLEARGFVKRKASSDDARVRTIALTPKGKRQIDAAFREHAQDLEDAVGALSADERATLIALLGRIAPSSE